MSIPIQLYLRFSFIWYLLKLLITHIIALILRQSRPIFASSLNPTLHSSAVSQAWYDRTKGQVCSRYWQWRQESPLWFHNTASGFSIPCCLSLPPVISVLLRWPLLPLLTFFGVSLLLGVLKKWHHTPTAIIYLPCAAYGTLPFLQPDYFPKRHSHCDY